MNYTNALGDITWDRIRQHNVLVIYITPDAFDVTIRAQESSPERFRGFAALVEKYVAAGGGVLLLPTETNVLKRAVIDLTDLWGSKTTVTVPVDLAKSTMPVLERPFFRPAVPQPALAAIRPYKSGRVALVNQWRQFSVGSGTRYIFQRQVLSQGAKGKPSDFGRLLENTYRWLAEPSLAGRAVGGYVTRPERLLPPNRDPAVRKDYADRVWPYDPAKLGEAGPPQGWKLYRGMIGARSSLGGGRGSVADYARAATGAGLDFLVFMDDFEKLDPRKLAQLSTDCQKSSTDKIRLYPGFSIRNNVGNRMFFYSPDPGHAYLPLYPDHAALTHVVAGHPVIAGPEGKELFLQVTKVGQNPDRWHVSINNPTDRAITTTLTRSIPLPGLDLPQTKLTLKPGEYLVVR